MTKNIPIVKEPNKVLRASAKDVDADDIRGKKIQKLITDMKVTLKNTPDGVGLAAPQVGKSLNIFIVSEEAEEIDKAEKRGWEKGHNDDGKPSFAKASEGEKKPYEKREWKYHVFINPVVKNISKKKLEGPEGCLSVPGKYGTVKRHEKITVQAIDEHGKKFIRGASRFFARVTQHELDHLQGTLFIDKAEKIIEAKPNGG
ncbi:MAG: peptide deformylase [Candidatus Sungbacteria bacterium]|nr:peptide deformylase [Candidatus Sungbacteria bacterium]